MTSPDTPPRILAVDIATTGVRVLIVESDGDGSAVLSLGAAPRWTLRSAMVVDPPALEAAIRDALRATGTDPADTPAYVGLPAHEPHAPETSIRRDAEVVAECCERTGLRIRDTIPAAVASALAVTTDEERGRGVGVVDLGAGHAKIAVYLDGVLDRVGAGRYRGHTVVGDVALGLRTPVGPAERIVIEHGGAMPDRVPLGELVDVQSLGGGPSREIERRIVAELIHDRLVEIFADLRDRHAPPDLRNRLGAGIVVTGGYSRLPAIADLAEEVFDVPVRLGTPVIAGRDDLGPEQATVAGLALIAAFRAGDVSWRSLATPEAVSR